ncbi:AMP-binding protein [Legionella yabuuchiae]|uniref:AMP-binding protein n=1 Tax=Legionella yabuuchiae TaxID=376727 RepID=UPI001055E8DC|nr:AMP-binding protein [Legionella yabuuchiae]
MKGSSVVDILLNHEKEHADRIYLRQPRHGKWHEYSWEKTLKQARQVAQFLKQIGLKKGAHVSIFSKNCAEWFITDFGITLAGMVNVPLFANQHEESIEYVLDHAEVKLVFLGKLDNHNEVRQYIPNDLMTVAFDYHPDMDAQYRWVDVLGCEPLKEVKKPAPEDTYTIIYSSGTSGKPKGAVYTHQAIANYLAIFPEDINRLAPLDHYHLLSYLPLAHVYERSAIQLGSIAISSDVSFVQSLDTFAENLREVEPSLFAAVPRIWGVFQNKIEEKISSGLPHVLLQIPFLSKLVKHKVKQQLGLSRSEGNISGAAHLPLSIYNFFDNLDIPILEGYGQTENFAYATLSLPEERRPGYVGTPRLNVEIKKGKDDELLMRCPCLMKEFYKSPEQTAEAFTEDGWLRTGDIVEIDEQQRVKILGRLSENFKNQKGEFIAPTPIEKAFSDNNHIEHLCLVGKELPSNVMVVCLTEEARKKPENEVRERLRKTLKSVNQDLKGYEKISHVLVVKDTWNVENNFLTPTLKVKRREVESEYEKEIQNVIEQSDTIVWE